MYIVVIEYSYLIYKAIVQHFQRRSYGLQKNSVAETKFWLHICVVSQLIVGLEEHHIHLPGKEALPLINHIRKHLC